MMDRIVPGGVAVDLAADGIAAVARCSTRSARRFPQLVELYDNTASLQDRTVTTGILRPRAGAAIRRRRLCRPRQRAAPSMRARRSGYPPYDQLDFEVPVLDGGRRQCARLGPHPRGRAEPRLIEQILARLPDGADRGRDRRRAGDAREGLALVEGFRGDVLVWLRLDGRHASRAAICATRPGSSGRCWKPRSKATSSPTSRSATNRSTAPIRGTISRTPPCASILFESLVRRPLTEAPPAAGRRGAGRARRAASTARRGAGSAAASRSARSMPAPATAASWKSTRSTTPSTISSASACASSPRRAMPTC